jgi:hypothetical protein
VTRPRAADDFGTIRARMEELRREREGPQATENDLQRDPPLHSTRSLTAVWQGKIRRLIINLPPRHGWPPSEIGAGSGRVRQSGPMRS